MLGTRHSAIQLYIIHIIFFEFFKKAKPITDRYNL